jgi:hypothetical protein
LHSLITFKELALPADYAEDVARPPHGAAAKFFCAPRVIYVARGQKLFRRIFSREIFLEKIFPRKIFAELSTSATRKSFTRPLACPIIERSAGRPLEDEPRGGDSRESGESRSAHTMAKKKAKKATKAKKPAAKKKAKKSKKR